MWWQFWFQCYCLRLAPNWTDEIHGRWYSINISQGENRTRESKQGFLGVNPFPIKCNGLWEWYVWHLTVDTIEPQSLWLRCIASRSHYSLWSFCLNGYTNIIRFLSLPIGGGGYKPISSDPLFSIFFSIVKTHINYWIARLYLTSVAAAEPWWQLLEMNAIERIQQLVLQNGKFCLRRN